MIPQSEIDIFNEIISACMALPDVKVKIIEITNNPQLN
jgi:hypothetical protein